MSERRRPSGPFEKIDSPRRRPSAPFEKLDTVGNPIGAPPKPESRSEKFLRHVRAANREALFFGVCGVAIVVFAILGVRVGTESGSRRSSAAANSPEVPGFRTERHWPKVDRSRIRRGAVQDVAEAFELGEESNRVYLTTEEERTFDRWRRHFGSLSENKDPRLIFLRNGRDGERIYRVKAGPEELGAITILRDHREWIIVALSEADTERSIEARQEVFEEAVSRAGSDES